MTHPENRYYEFGQFRLDLQSRVLLHSADIVPLTPKAFDTLLALVERRGELVERQELIKAVWPDSFVVEGNLNSNIFMLRKALGAGERDGESYIATVPRRGYRFAANVREVSEAKSSGNGAASRSLAVLPFKLFGVETSEAWLGLGLANALITRLSSIRSLIVRPTSAVSGYTGLEQNPQTVGRELNAELILEGAVQCAGERIRVTVQLVSVASGAPLWAEKFDERTTDIFAVEDYISERVANSLMRRLTDEDRKPALWRGVENRDAYQHYLRGNYYWNRRTAEGLKRAITCFNQAIALDPRLAPAHVGLADSYALLGCVHGALPPREAMPRAKAAAQKALELDEQLAEAHTALALTLALYDWDWAGAERAFLRALEINPTHATASHWYGLLLAWTGRLDEALIELRCAQQLDPFSPIVGANVAWALYAARRYDEAIAECLKTIEMTPNFYRAHVYLGWAYEQIGDFAAAISELRLAMELHGGGAEVTGIGHAYARVGRIDEANRVIAELRQRASRGYISPYAFALIYAGLNDSDNTFAWLERAYEDRTHWLVFLQVEPRFDRLREDPRFIDLLRRVHGQ
jgi:DNA-binding winged helix-turn-helix (wHTH) protein/tetratricopeptide (TPR) repeat protein